MVRITAEQKQQLINQGLWNQHVEKKRQEAQQRFQLKKKQQKQQQNQQNLENILPFQNEQVQKQKRQRIDYSNLTQEQIQQRRREQQVQANLRYKQQKQQQQQQKINVQPIQKQEIVVDDKKQIRPVSATVFNKFSKLTQNIYGTLYELQFHDYKKNKGIQEKQDIINALQKQFMINYLNKKSNDEIEQKLQKEVSILSKMIQKNEVQDLKIEKVFYNKFKNFEEFRYETNIEQNNPTKKHYLQYIQCLKKIGFNLKTDKLVLRLNEQSDINGLIQFVTVSQLKDYDELLAILMQQITQTYQYQENFGSDRSFADGQITLIVNPKYIIIKRFNVFIPKNDELQQSNQEKSFLNLVSIEKMKQVLNDEYVENQCLINCIKYQLKVNNLENKYEKQLKQIQEIYIKIGNYKDFLQLNKQIQDICKNHDELQKICLFQYNYNNQLMFEEVENGQSIVIKNSQFKDEKYAKLKLTGRQVILYEVQPISYQSQYSNIFIDLKNQHAHIFKNELNQLKIEKYIFYKGFKDIYIYDIENETFDIFQTTKDIQENFQKDVQFSNGKQRKADEKLIFECYYDFETVFDIKQQNMIIPYSVSLIINQQISDEKQSNKQHCLFYIGNDCVKQMFNFMQKIQQDQEVQWNMIGYNSSKFDNYLIFHYLQQNDYLHDVCIVSNKILQINTSFNTNFFDLCLITNCSLAKLCSDFKINEEYAKQTFNHNIIQEYYIQNQEILTYFGLNEEFKYENSYDIILEKPDYKFLKQLKNSEQLNKLVEYNIMDCVSLFILYYKIQNTLTDMQIINKSLSEYKTIGSISYKYFKQHSKLQFLDSKQIQSKKAQRQLNEGKLIFQMLNSNQFCQIKQSLIGGRTQCYSGRIIIDQSVKCLDVASLYPFVYLSKINLFPYGKIIENMSYDQCKQDGNLGFFKCRFNQKNLRYKIIPNRKEDGGLDWNYDGEIIQILNTVDIQQLIDNNCEIQIYNENSIVFSNQKSGYEMFESHQIIADKKTEQDKFKQEKSQLYNNSIREISKLILNSFSGKFGFSKFNEKTSYIKSEKQYDNMIHDYMTNTQKYDNQKVPELLYCFGNNKAIVRQFLTNDQALEQKSNQFGLQIMSFIYSYARQYMFQIINLYNIDEKLKQSCLYYQDTDSLKMKVNDVEYIKQKYGMNIFEENGQNIKQFGQFECEWSSTNQVCKSFVLAPKNYFYFNYKSDSEIKIKYSFKGINLTRDLLLNEEDLEKCKKMTHEELFRFYQNQDKLLVKMDKQKIVNINTYKNIEQFCMNLINGKPQFMLSRSIQKQIKVVKNKKVVSLYDRILIKQIN